MNPNPEGDEVIDHHGYACPECGANFHAPEGVTIHRRRAHGGAA